MADQMSLIRIRYNNSYLRVCLVRWLQHAKMPKNHRPRQTRILHAKGRKLDKISEKPLFSALTHIKFNTQRGKEFSA